MRLCQPVTIAGLALAGTGAFVAAQPQTKPLPANPEATIYRDTNFSGPAVAIQAQEPDLGLAWRVRSIRVPSGSWQLCSERNYRGTCVTVDRDRDRLGLFGAGLTVQSARYTGGGWGGGPGPGMGDGGQSLRGMMSQYYPLPMRYGREVPACQRGSATSNCASQTADRFCADMGWRVSVHERMETRGREVVLRDVLCSNAG
jgi:hypothetical protein